MLAAFYGQFQSQYRGQPPANEAAFKEFIRAVDGSKGATDNLDSLFLSERDRKPYVIVYGRPKARAGSGGMSIIAYEQDGKDGKRLVVNSLGMVQEVDQTRFQELTK
jgi:hypothetical protein